MSQAETIQAPNPPKSKLLTQEVVREILHYDPDTGRLTHRRRKHVKKKVGEFAGWRNPKDGRVHIMIYGRLYRHSRIIWLYMTGKFPDKLVDHKDGNPSNNVWTNLRMATSSQNNANRRKIKTYNGKNPASPLKGAHWSGKGPGHKQWVSIIRVNGKKKFLGTFRTDHEAHAAYCKAASEAFGEFARTS